jgi:2'-5' RNA ligase
MPTLSALIVPVPAAEQLVGSWRWQLDRAARWGIPTHITLVYPFAPPETIDTGVVSRLRALFAGVEPFAFSLMESRRFGDQVSYLAPSPDEPFRRLTEIIVAEFPDYPPYGGTFSEVIPHLTIADVAGLDEIAAAEAAVTPGLPLRCSVDEAWLMAGRAEEGSWKIVERFPLGLEVALVFLRAITMFA